MTNAFKQELLLELGNDRVDIFYRVPNPSI